MRTIYAYFSIIFVLLTLAGCESINSAEKEREQWLAKGCSPTPSGALGFCVKSGSYIDRKALGLDGGSGAVDSAEFERQQLEKRVQYLEMQNMKSPSVRP